MTGAGEANIATSLEVVLADAQERLIYAYVGGVREEIESAKAALRQAQEAER